MFEGDALGFDDSPDRGQADGGDGDSDGRFGRQGERAEVSQGNVAKASAEIPDGEGDEVPEFEGEEDGGEPEGPCQPNPGQLFEPVRDMAAAAEEHAQPGWHQRQGKKGDQEEKTSPRRTLQKGNPQFPPVVNIDSADGDKEKKKHRGVSLFGAPTNVFLTTDGHRWTRIFLF
ncbi:MAG: hypothetical protein GX574_06310 [Lentisphaerae bacterium]|nr:hypothetical protein [Lentisphaerota bacterium]